MSAMNMKIIKALLLISALFPLPVWSADLSNAQSGNEATLYRVRKVFLGTQTNEDLSEQGIAALTLLQPALKEALQDYGFTVVDNESDADAVMYGGNTTGWIALHGPPIDPPRYGFEFWLSSSKYNFKWKTKFNISSRDDESVLGRKAVQRAARNLFGAWKKSAKNVGIIIGVKLP
jgi:hypothetical protein